MPSPGSAYAGRTVPAGLKRAEEREMLFRRGGRLRRILGGEIALGLAADALGASAGAALLETVGVVNVLLAVFNLLPGFPLDGGRVFRAVVWRVTGDQARATRVAAASGRIVAAGLMAIGASLAIL